MRIAIYNSASYDLWKGEDLWAVTTFPLMVPFNDSIAQCSIVHYCHSVPEYHGAIVGALNVFEVEEPCPWCKKAVPDFYILQAKLGV